MIDGLLRDDGRALSDMRGVKLTRDVMKNALGSCLVEFGDTHVLCAATIEEGVPAWRKGAHAGWVTAEYSMLPASTNRRTKREYNSRKGRSMEIERLIGRSLRSVCNLRAMDEITVTLDCDVIQADGGTRTASITGAWVALYLALENWVRAGKIARIPITGQVAAISAGIVDGLQMLDLKYSEDSAAELDLNVVGTADSKIVEVQGTGERMTFSRDELNVLLDLCEPAIQKLCALQREVTGYC